MWPINRNTVFDILSLINSFRFQLEYMLLEHVTGDRINTT